MGFCLASPTPFARNDSRKDALMDKIPGEMHPHIMAYGTFLGDEREILAMSSGFPINRDWKPVLEYYFWRNRQRAAWEEAK
jgi:hypothetical protein